MTVLSIIGGHLLACDCKPEKTVKDEIKWADIVIHGKIIKVTLDTILNKSADLDDTRPINEYKVLVNKKYKGKISADTITIRTAAYDEACGLILKVGESLIFYAKKDTKKSNVIDKKGKYIYYTSNCTRTRLFNQVEQSEIEKEIGNR